MGSWVPTWLAVAWSAVFAGVLAVHLAHLLVMGTRSRLWHAGHVLMAAGMLDMYWPGAPIGIGERTGERGFAVAAVAAVGVAVIDVTGGRFTWLWSIAALDFAVMATMFAPTSQRWWVLSVLLASWCGLEALGWASGALSDVVAPDGLVLAEQSRADPRREEAVAGDRLATSVLTATTAAPKRIVHAWSTRVTLTLISAGTAYMLLAMQFGASQMHGMPGR
jgi:hypothetical protein